MSSEERAARLFEAANPVPNLDLMDPLNPLDVLSLEETPQRRRAMVDVGEKKSATTSSRVRDRWLIPALVSAALVVAALTFVLDGKESVATPDGVATAFMEAIVRNDGTAAAALFAPDGLHLGAVASELPARHDWHEAVGWDFTNEGCAETSTGPGGTLVDCDYTFENDATRALGREPITGSFRLLINDENQITATSEEFNFDEFGDIWEMMIQFFGEEYPEDVNTMFVSDFTSPNFDPQSIALWEERMPGFVDSLSG